MLNHLDLVASYTIIDVAEFADVSKSALLRFCKKLGYSGYSEFKFEVSRFLLSGPMPLRNHRRMSMNSPDPMSLALRKFRLSDSITCRFFF